jgi:hypothetical protein
MGLWDEVEAHNVTHGFSEDEGYLVWFYVGQYMENERSDESP